MPFYLEEIDIAPELSGCSSVLIVPCRFCPAVSAAVKNDAPYIEFFRRFLKTDSYERQIRALQLRLEKEGIRAKVFKSDSIYQFVLCMWPRGQRQKLLKEAMRHDAVVVLGCEAAVETVTESIKSSDRRVIHCMRTEGVINVIPKFRFPGNIWLKRISVTPLLLRKGIDARADISKAPHRPGIPRLARI